MKFFLCQFVLNCDTTPIQNKISCEEKSSHKIDEHYFDDIISDPHFNKKKLQLNQIQYKAMATRFAPKTWALTKEETPSSFETRQYSF